MKSKQITQVKLHSVQKVEIEFSPDETHDLVLEALTARGYTNIDLSWFLRESGNFEGIRVVATDIPVRVRPNMDERVTA